MKPTRRQEFNDSFDDSDSPSRNAPVRRSYGCAAYGCSHVGAIRLPGHPDLLCEAHAMADARHWQRITEVLRKHADLLAACRHAMSFPTGLSKEDAENARLLLEMAEMMPTGLVDRLPEDRRARLAAGGVQSRYVGRIVSRAIVDLALSGTVRKVGAPQEDPDGEVAHIRSRFGRLIDQASAALTTLHDIGG